MKDERNDDEKTTLQDGKKGKKTEMIVKSRYCKLESEDILTHWRQT